MKDIHVCHVASGYFRDNPRIFYRQCLSLKKNGFKVSLVINDELSNEVVEGIQISATKLKFNSRLLYILFSTFIFFRPCLREKADIYQLHSPELIPLGLFLKLLRKKVIYDAHEDMESHILEKKRIPIFLRSIISKTFTVFMHFSLRFFDGVLTPHDHVLEKIKKINSNSFLVTNFPLLNKTSDFSLQDYINRGNIVCYSGTVYPHSCQDEVIQAVIAHPNAEYHIAGFISDDMLHKYETITSLHKFKYLGLIPSPDLYDFFYSSCSVGVCIFPYMGNLGGKRGTFAVNKLFEYMSAGLPIICSDYSLWKDIINKYKCGICVEPNNLKQIKDAITYILDNKDEAYLMGVNSKKAIEIEYNWNIAEKKYLSLFNFSSSPN